MCPHIHEQISLLRKCSEEQLPILLEFQISRLSCTSLTCKNLQAHKLTNSLTQKHKNSSNQSETGKIHGLTIRLRNEKGSSMLSLKIHFQDTQALEKEFWPIIFLEKPLQNVETNPCRMLINQIMRGSITSTLNLKQMSHLSFDEHLSSIVNFTHKQFSTFEIYESLCLWAFLNQGELEMVLMNLISVKI